MGSEVPLGTWSDLVSCATTPGRGDLTQPWEMVSSLCCIGGPTVPAPSPCLFLFHLFLATEEAWWEYEVEIVSVGSLQDVPWQVQIGTSSKSSHSPLLFAVATKLSPLIKVIVSQKTSNILPNTFVVNFFPLKFDHLLAMLYTINLCVATSIGIHQVTIFWPCSA